MRGADHLQGPTQLIQEDIRLLKSALAGKRYEDIFVPSVSPSLLANYQRNLLLQDQRGIVFAIAEAMREEYRRSSTPGFMLQIDDPRTGSCITCASRPEHRGMAQVGGLQVEALNHALRGIPPERIRHHTCYGINMGPRTMIRVQALRRYRAEDPRRRLFVRGGQSAP